MGASIALKVRGKWQSITPGWRSQMATWLHEIAGSDRDVLVFTDADLTTLQEYKKTQRRGIDPPPFDQSEEWSACFDKIIAQVRERGEALVRISY